MQEGTIRKMRDRAMRHMSTPHGTRDSRQRQSATENCHAALRHERGATREYQSDTSSKKPTSSVFSRLSSLPPANKSPPQEKEVEKDMLDKVGPYQPGFPTRDPAL